VAEDSPNNQTNVEPDSAQAGSGRNSFNTIQREPTKKRWSYSARMTMLFACVAIMTAAIFFVVLAVVWNGQFKEYARQNMQLLAQSSADAISVEYASQGEWNDEVINSARTTSSSLHEVGFQVLDVDGTVIYESTPTSEIEDEDEGDYDSAVTADVTDSDGSVVGSVRIWANGSSAPLTKADAQFLDSSYSAIFTAAIIGVILACVIGYFASRSLTKPIQRITRTAAQIRNGDLTARTGLSGTDEIGQLGETFDDMATSLEKDIKLEHRLTSDVAHELRTPLMAIQATVEAMQDGILPADNEHFETLDGEVRHLSRLIDAMLRLSRLENGKTELHTEHSDIVFLVKSLVASQHQLFHDKGLHLRFNDETPHGECYADVDQDMIREAVVNLMSNAMRYTDEGGWIVVSVGVDRSDVFISVRDTGIGMSKEDITQVFSRFWRSDVSREREHGGLGVGLSITKEIVDRHNGTITVESELGKGSTFTIKIPQNRSRRSLKQAHQDK
jgi:two-component system sensor histidine kinase BaeS